MTTQRITADLKAATDDLRRLTIAPNTTDAQLRDQLVTVRGLTGVARRRYHEECKALDIIVH